MRGSIPPEIRADLAQAQRLGWWTIVWMSSIVLVMSPVTGSSQAMRTALIEYVLSIIPAIVLLIALRLEGRPPTARFHHGFDRAHSLAFLIAATALAGVGGVLLEALATLMMHEQVEIPVVELFGQQIWLGWLMIAALAYSVVPPFILGRLKLPVAKRIHDAVLHTDAKMQKADWMTGLAGIGGILGIYFGVWWADAAAAVIISLSILSDGITALRIAAAELADGVPRELGEAKIAPDADALLEALRRRCPEGEVRLRESGRYILAEIHGARPPAEPCDLAMLWPGKPERAWRFASLSFVPTGQIQART